MIESMKKTNNKKMRESNLFGFSSGVDFLSSLFGTKWSFINIIHVFTGINKFYNWICI